MSHEPTWVGWSRELQAIAQTGLQFSKSEYDRERYRKILEISAEIFANYAGESLASAHIWISLTFTDLFSRQLFVTARARRSDSRASSGPGVWVRPSRKAEKKASNSKR